MSFSKSALVVTVASALVLVVWLSLRSKSSARSSVMPEVTSVEPMKRQEPVERSFSSPQAVASEAEAALPENEAPQQQAQAIAATRAEPRSATLYGFVRAQEGVEWEGEVFVSATDRLGIRRQVSTGPDGAYALGVSPGSLWIEAASRRMGRTSVRIELDRSEGERRLDLELIQPPSVRVKVVDADGEPWIKGVELAVATLEHPGEWFTEVSGSYNNHHGVGKFWQSGFASEQLPDEYIGTVLLDREPPVHISLLNYHRVVATQRVEPGQQEVAFVLDRESPLLQHGELHFSFVDAATGERLESGGASLSGRGIMFLNPTDGIYRASVSPGLYEIVASVDGYSDGRRQLRVEAGPTAEVLSIPLEQAISIEGRIVDASNVGVAGSLYLYVLDGETGARLRSFGRTRYSSNADGSFRIGGLSRASYLLSFNASDTNWGHASTRVDTQAGPVQNVEIRVARGVPLVVRPSGTAVHDVRFEIFDAQGGHVLSTRLWSEVPRPIPLAPGNYEVECRVGDGEPKRIPVTIANDPVELELP